jgi:hypothetical protein
MLDELDRREALVGEVARLLEVAVEAVLVDAVGRPVDGERVAARVERCVVERLPDETDAIPVDVGDPFAEAGE